MPPKSHETRFATLVEELSREAGVTPPSDEPGAEGKFGSAALKVDGKIFAMLVRGELVVKLPRRRVDALVASGDGRPFDTGRGRIMKEGLPRPGLQAQLAGARPRGVAV